MCIFIKFHDESNPNTLIQEYQILFLFGLMEILSPHQNRKESGKIHREHATISGT